MNDEATPEQNSEFVNAVARHAVENPFAIFETIPTGEIDWGVLYFMRIGHHLGKPTQAIMSQGKFIKMRHAPKWTEYVLRPLDPTDPKTNLYGTRSNTWQPKCTLAEQQREQLELEKKKMELERYQYQSMAALLKQRVGMDFVTPEIAALVAAIEQAQRNMQPREAHQLRQLLDLLIDKQRAKAIEESTGIFGIPCFW